MIRDFLYILKASQLSSPIFNPLKRCSSPDGYELINLLFTLLPAPLNTPGVILKRCKLDLICVRDL